MQVSDSFSYGQLRTTDALQSEIESMKSRGGGVIWVHSDVILSSPLVMRDHVQVDFQRHMVTLGGHFEFAIFENVTGASVRNVEIKTSSLANDDDPRPIILLRAKGEGVCSRNYVTGIFVRSGAGRLEDDEFYYGNQVFDGIHLEVDEGGGTIYANTIERIVFDGLCTTLLLKNDDTGRISANLLSDIFGQHTTNAMRFDVDSLNPYGICYNTFRQIRFEPFENDKNPELKSRGVGPLPGFANHFDRLFMWDWEDPSFEDCFLESTTLNCYFNVDLVHRLTNLASDSPFYTFLECAACEATPSASYTQLKCASGDTPTAAPIYQPSKTQVPEHDPTAPFRTRRNRSAADGVVIRTRDGQQQYTQSQIDALDGGATTAIHNIIKLYSNGAGAIAESYVGLYAQDPLECSDFPSEVVSEDDTEFVASLGKAPFESGDRNWSVCIEVLLPMQLSSPIRLVRGVEIDFCNQLVTLVADISLAIWGDGYLDCTSTCIRNVRVQPYNLQTQPVFLLQLLPRGAPNAFGHVKFNQIDNVRLQAYTQTFDAAFDVIKIASCGSRLVTTSSVGGNTVISCADYYSFAQSNEISCVRATGARCVIALNRRDIWAGFLNLTSVVDVWAHQCRQAVQLHWPNAEGQVASDTCSLGLSNKPQLNFNHYYFVRISSAASTDSLPGLFYVAGQGNTFEHIASIDNNSNQLDMTFHNYNNWTYICSHTLLGLPTITGQQPMISAPCASRNIVHYDATNTFGEPCD